MPNCHMKTSNLENLPIHKCQNDILCGSFSMDGTTFMAKKIICNTCVYQAETDTFIGIIVEDTITLSCC